MSSSDTVEKIDQFLLFLAAISSEEKSEKIHQLAQKSTEILKKLRSELKHGHVQQLAQLVQTGYWGRAAEAMKNKFPRSSINGVVEEILALVYVGNDMQNLKRAIEWLEHLEADLQLAACKALYDQIKFKNHQDEPSVLLLRKLVGTIPDGVLDTVRSQLESDHKRIINYEVWVIKEGYMQDELPKMNHGDYKLLMPDVVSQFNVCDLDTFLLLIKYSVYLCMSSNYYVQDSIHVIIALFGALEERSLLDSEQALHLWANANFIDRKRQGIKACFLGPQDEKMFIHALVTLTEMKHKLFPYYQSYVEDQNKQKLKNMHSQNMHLHSILTEFVSWYYDGDLEKAQNLFAAAKSVTKYYDTECQIVSQLHEEMEQRQQMDTFEAFHLFVKAKRLSWCWDNKDFGDLHFKKLKAIVAPECVRLLTAGADRPLRLLNKFFNVPLCVQNDKVFCFDSREDEEQVCTAFVDPDTALTSFSFNSGDDYWELDVSAPDGRIATMAENGTQWKIRALDQHHVKIYTHDEKFLTAGEPWQEDRVKRIVCLMDENSTEMQKWKIEAADIRKSCMSFAYLDKTYEI